jgi:predicted SAM-dependent methyltransferase
MESMTLPFKLADKLCEVPLPFKPIDKVCELGGGETPVFHPNLDVRPLPTVDIVADLTGPLPLESNSYDGVYSSFLMEHLPLQKVRGFIGEIHRILKPDGIAVIITANLLEQARVLIETNEWDNRHIHLVFGGDPPYEENYHKSSMSPQFAIQLFKEAGFHEVTIYEHPVAKQIWGRSTDMIVVAKKSRVRIERSL